MSDTTSSPSFSGLCGLSVSMADSSSALMSSLLLLLFLRRLFLSFLAFVSLLFSFSSVRMLIIKVTLMFLFLDRQARLGGRNHPRF